LSWEGEEKVQKVGDFCKENLLTRQGAVRKGYWEKKWGKTCRSWGKKRPQRKKEEERKGRDDF